MVCTWVVSFDDIFGSRPCEPRHESEERDRPEICVFKTGKSNLSEWAQGVLARHVTGGLGQLLVLLDFFVEVELIDEFFKLSFPFSNLLDCEKDVKLIVKSKRIILIFLSILLI